MNILDIVLVIVVFGYGIAGFRQGFIIGASGVVGLLIGGLGGAWLAPPILNRLDPSLTVSILALAIVLGCALIGQALGAHGGAWLRARVPWRPVHFVDATGGAVLSVVAVLVVAWLLGSAVAGAHFGDLSGVVRSSRVLAAVDKVVPSAAERAFLTFTRVVDPAIFPRYLSPFTPELIRPVDPPDEQVLDQPGVATASDSVVKVVGVAESCSRSLEGSGFVYSAERVMTNAHVVAGVESPRVEALDGRVYDAEVVVYDSDLDIAVLAVPGLGLPALAFDPNAERAQQGAVLGYPGGGDFTAGPARIRAEQTLSGPDIYGQEQVDREVFSLYAEVRPGNSGGPLISPDGTVWGVVFAASVEDPSTGYALTAEEVADDAAEGIDASTVVSTGGCAS